MKFLVIERHRAELTREQLEKIALSMFAYLGKLEKMGKVQNWTLAGQPGGVMLFDVESNEELAVLISSSPIYPYTTREILPLWEPAQAARMTQKLADQMKELE